jgi:hypothetical protein
MNLKENKMNTKTNRVFEALVLNGEELTAKQISSRYNAANPHDTIYQIRNQGYAIYLNERTDSKGRVTKKYRHGAPSRAIVAAGYKAMAAGLV